MSLAFKLLFPPYWLYFVTAKPVFWAVSELCRAPKRLALKWRNSKYYPKSKIGRVFFWAFALWAAPPGSIPATAYFLGKQFGYEKEVDMVMNWAMSIAGWAWDGIVLGYKVAVKAVELVMLTM